MPQSMRRAASASFLRPTCAWRGPGSRCRGRAPASPGPRRSFGPSELPAPWRARARPRWRGRAVDRRCSGAGTEAACERGWQHKLHARARALSIAHSHTRAHRRAARPNPPCHPVAQPLRRLSSAACRCITDASNLMRMVVCGLARSLASTMCADTLRAGGAVDGQQRRQRVRRLGRCRVRCRRALRLQTQRPPQPGAQPRPPRSLADARTWR
jgi:hypothetical protein